VPTDHGVGLDDDQDLLPARTEPAERGPEGSVERSQPGLPLRLGVDGQLLAKGKLNDPLLAAPRKRARAERSNAAISVWSPSMGWRSCATSCSSNSLIRLAGSFQSGRRAQDRKSNSKPNRIEDTQVWPGAIGDASSQESC
jgi:hypothetical protein